MGECSKYWISRAKNLFGGSVIYIQLIAASLSPTLGFLTVMY
jgi:hypothetical protein